MRVYEFAIGFCHKLEITKIGETLYYIIYMLLQAKCKYVINIIGRNQLKLGIID